MGQSMPYALIPIPEIPRGTRRALGLEQNPLHRQSIVHAFAAPTGSGGVLVDVNALLIMSRGKLLPITEGSILVVVVSDRLIRLLAGFAREFLDLLGSRLLCAGR